MSFSIHQNDYAKLAELAKTKPNGVYLKSPYLYAVKNNCLVLIGNKITGQAAACSGFFVIDRGAYDKAKLRKIMENSI